MVGPAGGLRAKSRLEMIRAIYWGRLEEEEESDGDRNQ